MQKELMYISKARNREGCKRRRIQIFFKKRRRRTFPSTYNKKKKEKKTITTVECLGQSRKIKSK
jgi:hypothetical protein